MVTWYMHVDTAIGRWLLARLGSPFLYNNDMRVFVHSVGIRPCFHTSQTLLYRIHCTFSRSLCMVCGRTPSIPMDFFLG